MNGQVEFKAEPRDDGGPAFPVNDMQRAHDVAMAASINVEGHEERERAYILARGAAVTGMSLRDYFAAAALPAVIGTTQSWKNLDFHPKNGLSNAENDALCAYQVADAMLKARAAS